MSKFVSFTKYKEYLESQGYSLEKKSIDWGEPLNIKDYVFSKEGDDNIYKVTVFTKNNEAEDHIVSINYGRGSIFSGCWKRISIDFRKKFWKELTINE